MNQRIKRALYEGARVCNIFSTSLTHRQFTVQNVFKVSESSGWDLTELAHSEVRIILLYCTQLEASKIMVQAGKHGLTNINYLWLVTQSVVGDPDEIRSTRNNLPTGMIGKIKYRRVQVILAVYVNPTVFF